MKLRRPSINDYSLIRELKLAALHDSPETFADSLEDTQQKPPQYWINLTESLCSEHVMFIAEESEMFVGSVYGLRDSNNEKIGRVAGMWVSSSHRRRGIGRALFNQIVSWADSRDFLEIHL